MGEGGGPGFEKGADLIRRCIGMADGDDGPGPGDPGDVLGRGAFGRDGDLDEDPLGAEVLDMGEGERIAAGLGSNKACILQNHGLVTVGQSVEEAAWWFITMERSCQAQLLAEAAGKPKLIGHENALKTYETVGSSLAGWFSFQPLYSVIAAEQPDLFD